MRMTENDKELLIQLGHSLHVVVSGKTEKVVLLRMIRAVEAERAEATEPEVRDEDRCQEIQEQTGRRCVKPTGDGQKYSCKGACDFAPTKPYDEPIQEHVHGHPAEPSEEERERFDNVFAITCAITASEHRIAWEAWLARAAQAHKDEEGLRAKIKLHTLKNKEIASLIDENVELRAKLKEADDLLLDARNILHDKAETVIDMQGWLRRNEAY